jgi:N-acylneuraminate cytidylyltransferase
MWPVLQHALAFVEAEEGQPYDLLVLLDPTSPTRLPQDVERVVAAVLADLNADLALTVSEPHFSPYWHMLVRGPQGYGESLMPKAREIVRRQECPPTYFINGLAYAFQAFFLRSASSWAEGRFLMVETPATRATSIDTVEEFRWTEALIEKGLVPLPWLQEAPDA